MYNELIDNVNGDATDDILASTYENIIVVHHNLLTTFKKLELVQSMLGDLGDDDDNDESRRLQEEKNCNANATFACHKDNSRCNCDDKEFNCDCTPNYDFLKIQSGAGCDQFDSDGDTFIDNCEDITAPRLILKDPNQFQCDLTNPSKLCYNRNTFMEFGHAQTYLLANVQIIDDCAGKDQLRINVTETKNTTTCEVIYGKKNIMQDVLSLLLLHCYSSCTSRIDTRAVILGNMFRIQRNRF